MAIRNGDSEQPSDEVLQDVGEAEGGDATFSGGYEKYRYREIKVEDPRTGEQPGRAAEHL